MWKIIKADFRYHKFVFIVPVSIVLAGLIANLVQGWRQLEHDFQGMRTVMAVTTAFIFFFKYVTMIGEKRARHDMLLPLKSWQIGLPRLLFTILIWSAFLILYWSATAMVRPYRIDIIIWDTISLSGLILIANALMFIFVDLNYTSVKRIHKLMLALLYPFFVLCGFIAFFIFGVSDQSWQIFKMLLPFKADFSSFSATAIGAMISLLIGLAATYWSLLVFEYRRTYLQ
jgi:hypothetical protein